MIDGRVPPVEDIKEREDWMDEYPDAHDEWPPQAPISWGKRSTITTFVDAGHGFDQANRRSITGYVIYLNSTPVMWNSKKQGCVECSTYGAEMVALREAVEALKVLLYDIRSMGGWVRLPVIVYCDNQSVLSSGSTPGSPLKKKHLGLAYHLVRETVAAGIFALHYVPSGDNLADILTKPLGSFQARKLTDRLLWTQ